MKKEYSVEFYLSNNEMADKRPAIKRSFVIDENINLDEQYIKDEFEKAIIEFEEQPKYEK